MSLRLTPNVITQFRRQLKLGPAATARLTKIPQLKDIGRRQINLLYKPEPERVEALGDLGQPLVLAGVDKWTGGIGATTNDEVFGGEAFSGWTVTTNPGPVVCSRMMYFKSVTLGGSLYGVFGAIQHNASGTQNIDGDITAKYWWNRTMANNGDTAVCEIGLANTAKTDRAHWENNGDNTTEWTPEITNGGNTETGTTINIPEDSWHKFKIIIKAATTEFYLDDVLKETLSQANAQPNDDAMSGYVQFNGDVGSTTTPIILRIKRAHFQYGTT